MVQGAVCHLDLPVLDMERAKKFYGDVFGFTFMPWKPEYCLFTAGNSKCLAGGFVLHTGPTPLPKQGLIVPYILTKDLCSAGEKIHQHGGAVIGNQRLIAPGMAGAHLQFMDTEGNVMAVYAEQKEVVEVGEPVVQEVDFKMSPNKFFEYMMDSELHSRIAGKAQISREEKGAISAADYITGRNVTLVPGQRIVQSWRGADFPVGVFSLVDFEITTGANGGAHVKLTHSFVPKDKAAEIGRGWCTHYWDKLHAVDTAEN